MFRSVIVPLLLTLAGCGTPSLLITPVSNTEKLEEINADPEARWTASKIAIIEVEGMLINARTGGLLQAAENKLSLFAQEMGREVNTIGSKANDAEISRFVVDIKTALERIREQIQNVE